MGHTTRARPLNPAENHGKVFGEIYAVDGAIEKAFQKLNLHMAVEWDSRILLNIPTEDYYTNEVAGGTTNGNSAQIGARFSENEYVGGSALQ